MDDNAIVELLWAREESGLKEIQTKYGGYLYTVANNILANSEDSSECVNDTYMRAWQSIPPKRPVKLGAYLAVIARRMLTYIHGRAHLEYRLLILLACIYIGCLLGIAVHIQNAVIAYTVS